MGIYCRTKEVLSFQVEGDISVIKLGRVVRLCTEPSLTANRLPSFSTFATEAFRVSKKLSYLSIAWRS
jgi:hypothetical protein